MVSRRMKIFTNLVWMIILVCVAGAAQETKQSIESRLAYLDSVDKDDASGRIMAEFVTLTTNKKMLEEGEIITADVSQFYSLLKLGQHYSLKIIKSGKEWQIEKIVNLQREYPEKLNSKISREKFIKRDLSRIRKLLKTHGSWTEWQKELRPFLDELLQMQKDKGKFLVKGRRFFHRLFVLFRVLGDLEHRPNIAFECLKELDRFLKSKGIDLILVPVPFQEEIFAENFSDKVPADGITLPANLRFMQDCLRADIEMIDLAPVLKEANRKDVEDIYYKNTDHHPASGGLKIIAREIAKRLARYKFKKDLEYVYVSPDLYPNYKGYEHHEDFLSAEAILDENFDPVKLRDDSPIYIFGDSNTRIPNKFGGPVNTQIAYQIARFTGVIPKLSTQTKATKVMRGMIRNGKEKLFSSKVVVFLFHYDSIYHSKEFVYSDWEKIDLEKAFASSK
jgi:hypothetical protein